MKKFLILSLVVIMAFMAVGCNKDVETTTTTEVEAEVVEPVVDNDVAIWGHENIYDVEILDVNDSMVTFDINGQIVTSTDLDDIRMCKNHEGKTCMVNVALVGDADADTWSRYEFRINNGVRYVNTN